MSEVFEALREQDQELFSMVTGLPEDQLALPSACEGWSVSDVLLHLAQTNEMAAASASGQLAGVAGGSANSEAELSPMSRTMLLARSSVSAERVVTRFLLVG